MLNGRGVELVATTNSRQLLVMDRKLSFRTAQHGAVGSLAPFGNIRVMVSVIFRAPMFPKSVANIRKAERNIFRGSWRACKLSGRSTPGSLRRSGRPA
jgi:hypothetical protein